MTKLSDRLRSLRTVPANVGSLMQACEDAARALDACEVVLEIVKERTSPKSDLGTKVRRALKMLEDDHASP